MIQVEGNVASIAGADVEVRTYGSGPPLLFLHGEDGVLFAEPFIEELAAHFEVVVPSHPGWGRSPRASQFRSVDDLSYLYLDLIETFSEPIPVVGASFGGWLAVEVATKSCHGISHLALIAPTGLRLDQEPTTRSFVDIYAVPPAEVAAAMYGEASHAPDISGFDDEQLLYLAHAQEAVTVYTWQPYMHNPTLRERLHRITVPTLLVGGGQDGFILTKGYLDSYAEQIGAKTETVTLDSVGHRVEEQAPAEVAGLITKFVNRES